MAKPKHPILNEYNLLKESFNQNPLASAVTDIIINIHNECQNELKSKQKHNLNPGNGTIGKTYFYFSDDKKHSRPVNQALFEDGYQPATDFSGKPYSPEHIPEAAHCNKLILPPLLYSV